MNTSCAVPSLALRRRHLASCLTLAIAVGSTTAAAVPAASLRNSGSSAAYRGDAFPLVPTLAVTTCDDDGVGSLRAAVVAASSGDSIDLTGLTCSTITLTTGFIDVTQDDLSLIGPGAGALAIDAGLSSGVIRHSGAGTLTVSDLTLSHGYYQSSAMARGGCLYSAANLSVVDSIVSDCSAVGTSNAGARGGGVYAHGDLSLQSSLVTNSKVQGRPAHGGGLYVEGNFTADGSTISNNFTYGIPINGGEGGGAMIVGTTMIHGTTISGNSAYSVGGIWTQDAVTIDSSTISGNGGSFSAGMRATYSSGSPTAVIVNSTITGNRAVATVGGINLIIPATISNTTIAFNDAFNGFGGILMSGPTLDLESSILAGNTGFGVPDDFAVYGSPVVTGANNLVVASSAPLPPDTIQSDPLLGILGDNGGPTQTIPLLAGSPAIDAGNDVAQLADDQRGDGFARVVGSAADIGAFEVQASDVIFADGFDPP